LLKLGELGAAVPSAPPRTEVRSLAQSASVSTLVPINSSLSFGLASHFSDTPPFIAFALNPVSGARRAVKNFVIDEVSRYGNLTRCPDGQIFGTAMLQQSGPSLVRLELSRRRFVTLSRLFFQGNNLRDDVRDLGCASNGDIYALADPTYTGSNSLFLVSPNTGGLRFESRFSVDRIAFDSVVPDTPESNFVSN
jgi:hypothetical protein